VVVVVVVLNMVCRIRDPLHFKGTSKGKRRLENLGVEGEL